MDQWVFSTRKHENLPWHIFAWYELHDKVAQLSPSCMLACILCALCINKNGFVLQSLWWVLCWIFLLITQCGIFTTMIVEGLRVNLEMFWLSLECSVPEMAGQGFWVWQDAKDASQSRVLQCHRFSCFCVCDLSLSMSLRLEHLEHFAIVAGKVRANTIGGVFFWHFFLFFLFVVLAPGGFCGFCGFVASVASTVLAPGGSWWLLVAPGGSWWLLVAPGGSGGSWWLLWLPWLLVAPGGFCGFCGFCGFYGFYGSYGSSIIYRSIYQWSMFTRCMFCIRYTLSICLSIYLSINLSINQSIYLAIHPSYLSIYPSIHLHLYLHLFLFLSI